LATKRDIRLGLQAIGMVSASLSLGACGQGSGPFDAGPPLDVPLAVVQSLDQLPDGGSEPNSRLVVDFSLGESAPISAIFDTGSSGVQILAPLLPPGAEAAITRTSTAVQQFFPEGNIEAEGVLASATVSFGGRATAGPIPVVVYDDVFCAAAGDCPSTDSSQLEAYLFNGYAAIIGAGMRNSSYGFPGLGNPIAQLPGSPSFIVEAPDFGGDAGILRIGPSPDEVATFETFQLPSGDSTLAPLGNGTPAWNDLGFAACVDLLGSAPQTFCGGALLDTGTPAIGIFWTGLSPQTLAPKSNVSVSLGTSGSPIGQFDITVGDPPQAGLDYVVEGPPLSETGDALILGLPLFSRFDVLWDQTNGRIGLLPH
jgi:hypothetical protein